jgi:hypothetical protein
MLILRVAHMLLVFSAVDCGAMTEKYRERRQR